MSVDPKAAFITEFQSHRWCHTQNFDEAVTAGLKAYEAAKTHQPNTDLRSLGLTDAKRQEEAKEHGVKVSGAAPIHQPGTCPDCGHDITKAHFCKRPTGQPDEIMLAGMLADQFHEKIYGEDYRFKDVIQALRPYLRSLAREANAPTEAMCDRARGFIMGLDLNCRTWAKMWSHLQSGSYPCPPHFREKAASDPSGHITKWDVAECIYMLMNSNDIEGDTP